MARRRFSLETYKRHAVRIVLSLVVLSIFLLHVGNWVRFESIERLEQFAYDSRLRVTTEQGQDERIVIVDIDEKSLAAEGQWPWGRHKLAKLVQQLFDHYQIEVLGFDVVWPEPDNTSGLNALEELAGNELRDDAGFQQRMQVLRAELDRDRIFADSIRGRKVVLGYFFSASGSAAESTRAGQLPPPSFQPGHFVGRKINFHIADGYGANLPVLQEAAWGGGHFNPVVDVDGVVRRVAMLYEYEDAHYEALSMAVSRAALGASRIEPGYAVGSQAGDTYSGLEWLRLGDRRVPVDSRVTALVPYRGPQGSFPYIPATDVLSGRADPAALRGRIVLVGASAGGLQDLRATPVQPAYPGVEVHANLIAGILDNKLKSNPAFTLGAEFTLVMISGLFMALLLPLLSPLWATIATLILLSGIVLTNLAIWHVGNLVLPMAAGVILILVMYLLNTTYALFVETRGKRQLAGLFGQYVPPELVDEMSENPEAFSLEGESREMTVLFSDVRNFTTISEGLNPKELSQLMNEFLTPMTRIIHDHRGTIDKYMGDAIMAFWGAPLPEPQHARRALEAGMAMLESVKALQQKFIERGWPEIRIGLGINTGNMSVGNMGSEFRMAYTVLGDAVNLGSRLEGLTKAYGVDFVVSESTRDAVPDFLFQELDRVRVKGKDLPVTIFEPIAPKTAVEPSARDEIKIYQQALKHYRAQNWDMAELQFLNLQKMSPARQLYRLYVHRISHFRDAPPPPDWDGVFTYVTK